MIFEKAIGNTPVKVRVYFNNQTQSIKVEFSRTFYAHKEVVESINYYLEKGVYGKKATDFVLHEIADWFSNFLNLAFKIGIASLDPFTGCRCLQRCY